MLNTGRILKTGSAIAQSIRDSDLAALSKLPPPPPLAGPTPKTITMAPQPVPQMETVPSTPALAPFATTAFNTIPTVIQREPRPVPIAFDVPKEEPENPTPVQPYDVGNAKEAAYGPSGTELETTKAVVPPPVDTSADLDKKAAAERVAKEASDTADKTKADAIAAADKKYKEDMDAAKTPTSTTPTIKPVEPPKTYDKLDARTNFTDTYTEMEAKFKNWAAGVEDPVYRTMANKLVTQFGMSNQAERDMMQMKINQDPSLAGQGAGRAMLGVLARDQNFSQDQVFANLSIENQRNIVDMQKYGVEGLMSIKKIRRDRSDADYNNLIVSGNFSGAARTLQDQIDEDMPGSGIVIDPNSLALRDPLNRADVAEAKRVAENLRLEIKGDVTKLEDRAYNERKEAIDKADEERRVASDRAYLKDKTGEEREYAKAELAEERAYLKDKIGEDRKYAENRINEERIYLAGLKKEDREEAAALLKEQRDRDDERRSLEKKEKGEDLVIAEEKQQAINNKAEIAAMATSNPAYATELANALIAQHPEIFPQGMTGDEFIKKAVKDVSESTFALTQSKNRLDMIMKSIDTADTPEKMEYVRGMLNTFMSDPANKTWFPTDASGNIMSADKFIAMQQPDIKAAKAEKLSTLKKDVRALVAERDGTFTKSEGSIKDLFTAQGINPVDVGRALTLPQVNEIFKKTGINTPITEAEFKTWDDEDRIDIAYRQKYADVKQELIEAPWIAEYDLIMGTEDGAKFTNKEFFPNGVDTLKSYLASKTLSPNTWTTDKDTGFQVATPKVEPWNDEALKPMFFDWPKASFGPDGKTVGSVYPGGTAYGDIMYDAKGQPVLDANGQPMKVTSTPEDAALDKMFERYRSAGGPLTANQWYFSTKGGDLSEPDLSNIPDYQGGIKDLPPIKGTLGALDDILAKVDEISKGFDAKVKPEKVKVHITKLMDSSLSDGMSYVFSSPKMYVAMQSSGILKPSKSGAESLVIITRPENRQPAKDVYTFYQLVDEGLTPAEAGGLIGGSIGVDRFKASYKLITGKDWVA